MFNIKTMGQYLKNISTMIGHALRDKHFVIGPGRLRRLGQSTKKYQFRS